MTQILVFMAIFISPIFSNADSFTGWIKKFEMDVSNGTGPGVDMRTYYVLVTGENEGLVIVPATVDQRPGRTRTLKPSSTAGISALVNHKVTIQGDRDQYLGIGRDFGNYKILDAVLVESFAEMKESVLEGTFIKLNRKKVGLKTTDGRVIEIAGFDTRSLEKKDLKAGRYFINLEGSFEGKSFNAQKANLQRR